MLVASARIYQQDLHDAVGLTHGLGGEVAVSPSSVPVARDRFRVEVGNDAEVLGDAVKQEPSHPQVVAHLNPFARADLELPLKKKKVSLQDVTCLNQQLQ